MIIGITGYCEDMDGNRCIARAGKDTAAARLVAKHGFVRIGLADPLKRFCQEVFAFSDEQMWGGSQHREAPDPRYLRRRAGALGSTYVGDMDLTDTVYEKHAHLVRDGHIPVPHEDEYLTPRHALQQLGTEWGRACYDNIWIEYGLRVAKRLEQGGVYYDMKYGLRTCSSAEQVLAGDAWVKPKSNAVFSDIRFFNEYEAMKAAGAKLVRVRRKLNLVFSDEMLRSNEHASESQLSSFEDDQFDYVLDNSGTIDELFLTVDAMMKKEKHAAG